ncbi:hypothetical protein M8J76_003534 [Diaphorina citri]|nr:hypothetical protein M8J76_003534 [Diaphorina citri]
MKISVVLCICSYVAVTNISAFMPTGTVVSTNLCASMRWTWNKPSMNVHAHGFVSCLFRRNKVPLRKVVVTSRAPLPFANVHYHGWISPLFRKRYRLKPKHSALGHDTEGKRGRRKRSDNDQPKTTTDNPFPNANKPFPNAEKNRIYQALFKFDPDTFKRKRGRPKGSVNRPKTTTTPGTGWW